ncbi:MAG TPA: FAD-dependent oxidoreductase, partial [Bacteroidia bacterium]|nr:FAD-dependent oxidoreductase [Bacteroidia bacterium]
MKQTDYLIIGQGIVGSAMALTLLRKGKSVMVIDEPKLSSSSRIAAGVYNPFNFRQHMNNWRAKEMVGAAKELYNYAEKISGEKIFTERKILKIFTSADERKLWERACDEKEGLLSDPQISEENYNNYVIAPYGIGTVNDGGSIDCGMFIYVVSEKLKEQNSFREEKFDPEKLEINRDGISYENISAGHLIFCEGHLATKNPWFKFLPIKPAKGQLLHVFIPGLQLKEVLNRGAYLMPLGNDRFVLGSTFDNDAVDEISTQAAKEELLNRLGKFVKADARVESQFAGIRPAVQDRRPIIGKHPDFPQLSIINGMGSKAVLLSPW